MTECAFFWWIITLNKEVKRGPKGPNHKEAKSLKNNKSTCIKESIFKVNLNCFLQHISDQERLFNEGKNLILSIENKLDCDK